MKLSHLFLYGASALAFSGHASFANAQTQMDSRAATTSQQISRLPVPDENTLARLVWSTMIALDNANRTNNYSVLFSLGSPQFQNQNSPQKLYRSFENLRTNRVDVGRTVLSTPTYYRPPEILSDNSLRIRGGFDFRPQAIRFDLIYVNVNGGWRINAISVVEMDVTAPKN